MFLERIQYYPTSDLAYGIGLEKIETMTIPEYSTISINDAIEFYQIHRYFEDKARYPKWSDEQFHQYIQKGKKLFEFTNRFFHSLDDVNIISEYNAVDINYVSAFWELFDSIKLYNRITEDIFDKLIHCGYVPIYDIFEKNNIVKKYGRSLRQYILENEWCVDLLIRFYEQDYTDHTKLYLPDELSGEEIANIFEKYTESDCVHIKNLNSIFYMHRSDRFPISDELRLKAKRRYASEMKNICSRGAVFESNIEVGISDEQKEEKKEIIKGKDLQLSYSYNWLKETLDYPSILNNFLYLFEYADIPQMRSSHVSVGSLCTTLEKLFSQVSRRVYPDYSAFRHINCIAMLQMQAYYNFLKDNNIRYEDVLQWFFTEYLQTEFGCPEMRVSLPSQNSTILEKCVNICSAMDMAIKQFSQYASSKAIDFELLSISSGSFKFNQIPSLVDHKYIYGNKKNFDSLTFLLFSDQCLLSYNHRLYSQKKEYSSFFDLIKNEQIFQSDYSEKDYPSLKYLSDFDLITVSDDGRIALGNPIKLTILKDLYEHEVISRWHYPKGAQPILQELVDQGLVFEESSLLTRLEVNYFNYLLNHAEYCNGFDLRNKYTHGNGQIISDEQEHIQNYNTLLRVMTILVIKINDDFCLHDEIDNQKRS